MMVSLRLLKRVALLLKMVMIPLYYFYYVLWQSTCMLYLVDFGMKDAVTVLHFFGLICPYQKILTLIVICFCLFMQLDHLAGFNQDQPHTHLGPTQGLAIVSFILI